MAFTLLVVIAVITLGYVFSKWSRRKAIPKGLKELPGPQGWPLIGNLLSFRGPLCHYLYEQGKVHGPLFRFTMGHREIVILNSNEIVSKTLKDSANNFSGRWQNILIKTMYHDSGIIFKDKESWSTQRSFVLKVLKNLGLGKQGSTEIVNHECDILIREIEERCDTVVDMKDLFRNATVNIISKLVMNKRFNRGDKDFESIGDIIQKIAQKNNFLLSLILMYPVLEKFPRFSYFLLWCTGRVQELNTVHDATKEFIEVHKKRFNIENESEDLIDEFLKEQYQLEKDNVKDHTFTDWQLIRVTIELFIAGYETTSTTLTWSMLLMANYPKIQEKVYNEIIHVVGSSRIPGVSDKKFLTYTQAVMDEILRFSSVGPLAVPHRVFEDAEVNGFFIPKDSIVFPNLYACHRDKDVWAKPFEFAPEHFLTTINNNDIKYVPRDDLIIFGVGKRQCLGEALARMEFFVIFTSILQRFKVKFAKGMNDETFQRIIQGTDGLVRAPLTSEIVFERRTSSSN